VKALAFILTTLGAVTVSALIAWFIGAVIVSTPVLLAAWLLGVALESIDARCRP